MAVALGGMHQQQSSAPPTGSGGDGSGGGLHLDVVWRQRCSAPLFAPAVVLDGCVITAAVDGSVAAWHATTGSQAWRCSLPGAIFVPPLLVPPVCGQHQQQVLLVGTSSGQLAALDGGSGKQLGAVQLGGKVTGMQLLPPAAAPASGQRQAAVVVAVTLAPGAVLLVDAHSLLASSPRESDRSSSGGGGAPAGGSSPSWLLDAVQLPGDVFAAPAAAGSNGTGGEASSSVAVGCRDDHLYLFQCACQPSSQPGRQPSG